MGGGEMDDAEWLFWRRAELQLGLVTLRDCASAGFTVSWVRHQVSSGRWLRLFNGVFKTTAQAPNDNEWELARVLAAGESAVLSHLSAARRLGLDVPRTSVTHLTVLHGRTCRRMSNVRLWCSRDLTREDITMRGPFPLTRVGRTRVDLAAILDDKWLRATVDSALRRRPSNLYWVRTAYEQHGRGRKGTHRLDLLLRGYELGDGVPASALESFAMELGLATGRKPRSQLRIQVKPDLWVRPDLCWPEVKLGIEVDSWQHHASRQAFETDRERDRLLLAQGWRVVRYTSRALENEKTAVVAEMARLYAQCAQPCSTFPSGNDTDSSP